MNEKGRGWLQRLALVAVLAIPMPYLVTRGVESAVTTLSNEFKRLSEDYPILDPRTGDNKAALARVEEEAKRLSFQRQVGQP